MPEVSAANPAMLEDAADRLSAAARILGAAAAEFSIAVPGWLGGGANGQATSAVALRARLDTSSDAFGLAAGALRQYAVAARIGGGDHARTGMHNAALVNVRDAAAQAASVVRSAAAMAPASPMLPGPSQVPAIEMISWGSAFDDVLGAGKAVGHGAESLGGDAVSAGKDLAHLGESAAGEVGDGLQTLDHVTSQAFGRLQNEWSTFHNWLVSSAGTSGWKSALADAGIGLGSAAGLLVGRRLRVLASLSRLLDTSEPAERSFVPYESRIKDGLERGGVNKQSEEIDEGALTPAQRSNYKRYLKKIPKNAKSPVIVRTEDGNVTFSTVSPGRVPGSYAIYTKTIDSTGKTVGYTKTTVLPDGTIAHMKDKMPK